MKSTTIAKAPPPPHQIRCQQPKYNHAEGVKQGRNFICYGSIDLFNRHLLEVGSDVILGGESKIILHGPLRPYRADPKVQISDLVYIGTRCIILPGLTIGRAAMIGAGSVVTTNVPPYTIAAGNPVRIIRMLTPLELMRYYTVRILMDTCEGTVEPDWSIITAEHVRYVLGIGTQSPYPANECCQNIEPDAILKTLDAL